MEELNGRVALITGAAGGLGRAMCIALAKCGVRIAAVDRNEEALLSLQREVRSHVTAEHGLEVFNSDLSEPQAASVVPRVVERMGSIDILINNAGLGQIQVKPDYHVNPPKFYEVSEEHWSRAVAVNAGSVFSVSRAVTPLMLQKGWGRIVNVTTSLGTMLRAGYAPYGPSKAAAEALSAIMAADLAGSGVTVNVIVPGGVVNTGMIPATAPFAREQLVQPEVMLGPLGYILSADGDGVTGYRFVGTSWNEHVSPADAATAAGAPIGWPGLAVLPVTPELLNTAR